MGIKDNFQHLSKRSNPPFASGRDIREYLDDERLSIGELLADIKLSRIPHTLLNAFSLWLHSDRSPVDLDLLEPLSLVDQLLNWIDDRHGPWAACLNLMDAHEWVPERDNNLWADERVYDIDAEIENPRWDYIGGRRPLSELALIKDAYDGAIRQCDQKVARVIRHLAATDELEDTFVVVTADHGDAFGEQSNVVRSRTLVGHTYGIHEAQVHVPLVVRRPTQKTQWTESEPASLTYLPSVIQALVSGEGQPEQRFVSSGSILCTMLPAHEGEFEYINQYDIDTDWLSNPVHAIYHREGEAILKEVT